MKKKFEKASYSTFESLNTESSFLSRFLFIRTRLAANDKLTFREPVFSPKLSTIHTNKL